jgi:hypothetical protein
LREGGPIDYQPSPSPSLPRFRLYRLKDLQSRVRLNAVWNHLCLVYLCLVFRVQGSGFWVQGSGFRVQGLGSKVYGSGFWGKSCEEIAHLSRQDKLVSRIPYNRVLFM